MSGAVDPADLLAGLDLLVLEEGQHVRSVVLIVLIDDVNEEHYGSLQVISNPETSHWTQLGMLLDATDGLRTPSWRDPNVDL